MTSGGNLCLVGTSKLICEGNQWTGSCVMRFLPKGRSEQTMILHIYYYIYFQYIYFQYTTVLCFSIRGGDARVSAPSRTWSVEGCLEQSLICWVITGLRSVFALVRVRLIDVKEIL